MNYPSIYMLMTCLVFSILDCSPARGQFKEEKTVQDSISILDEIMAIPANGIPQKMLHDSKAVAIIPNVIKGSFVVGARHGKGVILVRDENGNWHAPVFITLTGGNIGWQVGVQSTDVVLVFKTRKSVDGLLAGRITLGADAAVAAGPIGRQVAAATDSNLSAEIYSYSRSRGLFAGVAFDGSVIKTDQMSNAAYYRPTAQGGPITIPPSAQRLTWKVMQFSEQPSKQQFSSAVPALGSDQITFQQIGHQRMLKQQHAMQEVDHIRDQLAKLAPEMYELLDENWQQYLGLPAQIFQGNGHPPTEDLKQCLNRFDNVRSDPRYSSLANHPKFQSIYGLLKHYFQDLSNSKQPLNLPAPPPTKTTRDN